MCSANTLAKLCRLCALEIEYGFDIFIESEVEASLVILINKYLPIKVAEDEILPKQICQLCHNQVDVTINLIDRMVEGQHKLRKLYKKYTATIKENSSNRKEGKCDILEDHKLYSSEECSRTTTENGLPAPQHFEPQGVIALNQNLSRTRGESLIEEGVYVQKSDSFIEGEFISTLIDIQGSNPDIEMNDFAKGMDVKKVYESHPLVMEIEGIKPKKKRGRPKKDPKDPMKKMSKPPPNPTVPTTTPSLIENQARPKRNRNLPSRFRDSLAGKEFDKLLSSDVSLFTANGCDMSSENELEKFLEGSSNLSESATTHSLEGNTVVVTSNHRDELYDKLPEAVNIELNFSNANTSEETNEDGLPTITHTPTALVSSVSSSQDNMSQKAGSVTDLETILEYNFKKRKRGPQRKFKYFCEFCNKGFSQIGRYCFHLKLHKNMVLQCDECKSKFSNRENILLHQRSTQHKGIGVLEWESDKNMTIKCPLCQFRTFLTLDKYRAHMASAHKGQKPYLCTICNKRFAYKHSLKTHHFMHQPEEKKKRYSCKDCNKEFFHQSSLQYHRETLHNDGRFFVCAYCGCSFKHKQLLQRHHAVHSEDRPFSCKECGNSFKTKGNLYNHMNVHKSKAYTCEICSKKFRHTTSLNLHLRSHTGEKPFSCMFCGKNFSQNGNLKEHIRIHTGLKPFGCSFCTKKFTTSSQLRLHEKRHRGEYNYNCSVCSKGFFSCDALRNHEQKHKTVQSLPCEQCPKIFGDNSQFVKHTNTDQESLDETSIECKICGKIFNDHFIVLKHLEDHQMEKTWFISQPSDAEGTSVIPSSSQDVIYILPKKEDSGLQFLQFNTDEIFEDQDRDKLPSVNTVVTSIPGGFVLNPHASDRGVAALGAEGKIYSLANSIEGCEGSFEISLKDTDTLPLPFGISVCDDSNPVLVKRVFES